MDSMLREQLNAKIIFDLNFYIQCHIEVCIFKMVMRMTSMQTCELGNISPVTEHCVCKLCLYGRHRHYYFGNINLIVTTNKSSNKKYFAFT